MSRISRFLEAEAVSHRQTCGLSRKCFDCDPAEAYKCAHMFLTGGPMTRRLGSATLIALLFLSTGIRAQESASSGIVGQVIDTTKGAMPGATVTVINTGTNAQRVVNTDAEGRFSVPNLPPATYTVRVELSGFATAEIKELTLRNGEVQRPMVTLGLANVSENVTVVGMSPLLQTNNASVSQTITQKQIQDLPVAGRNLISFAALSAGATPQSFNRGT